MRIDAKVLAGMEGSAGMIRRAGAAALLVGFLLAGVAQAQQRSSLGGVTAEIIGDVLVITGSPINPNDNVSVILYEIPKGHLCPGDPTGEPPLPPLPEANIGLLQVLDLNGTDPAWPGEPLFPADVVGDLLSNCGSAEAIERGQDTLENTYPTVENIKTIRFYGFGGDDIFDCSEVTATGIEVLAWGGNGNDHLIGGEGDDMLFGESGDDVLNGGPGADELDGGAGNDVLIGGPGNDTLKGGSGFDAIDYLYSSSGVTVDLPNATVSNDGYLPAGQDEIEGVIEAVRGSNDNDTIYGNKDGLGTTILGEGGNDHICGGYRRDIIFGGPGNDRISSYYDPDFDDDGRPDESNNPSDPSDGQPDEGGDVDSDDDFIVGGGGDDTIWAGRGSDVVIGDDGIIPAPDWRPHGTDPFEEVRAGDYHPWTALDIPDPLTAPSGNDRIFGGRGADTLYGGLGSDIINGDDGLRRDGYTSNDNDTIYGDFGGSPEAVNSEVGAGDRIRGGIGDDDIYGGAGNDIMSGGKGADTLCGGTGDDTFIGGEVSPDGDGNPTGSATADDSHSDVADYSNIPAGAPGANGIYVDLRAGRTMTSTEAAADEPGDGDGLLGKDTFIGIENVIGSPNNDTIKGDDRSEPLARNGNGGGILFQGTIVFDGFDNFLRGGDGDDLLVGRDGVDLLMGEGGNDRLRGDEIDVEGDNDYLLGGPGNDSLSGQGGDDLLEGGDGDDAISGGSGFDTLNYYFGGSAITANLTNAAYPDPLIIQAPNTIKVGADTDTIINCGMAEGAPCSISADNPNSYRFRCERIVGSAANDNIAGYDADEQGNPLATHIYGAEGDDVIYCGRGDDYVDAGSGSDTVDPGPGDDEVFGGPSPTTPPGVVASTEVDTISYARATSGVTVNLTVSGPQDTIGAGRDDLVELENIIGSNFDDILTGNERANVLKGGAGDDVLRGRSDTDYTEDNKFYKTDDILDGGDGNDRADYRLSNPALLLIDLSSNYVPNDGEGGSDILISIEGTLTPDVLLTMSAGPDKIIAPGGSTLLEGYAYGGSFSYTYKWDTEPPVPFDPTIVDWTTVVIPGLSARNIAQPTAQPESTTTYRLTVTDSAGKVLSDWVKVTVASALQVNAGPDRSINVGQSTTMAASVTGGLTPYSIQWTPADGLSATNVLKPEVAPATTTTYTLTVTDALGQIGSDQVVVTVNDPFSVTVTADETVLALGESTQLHANVIGGTSLSYSWSPAAGLSSTTVPEPTASPTETTTYTVVVTDAGSGRTATGDITITIVNPAGSDVPNGSGITTPTGTGTSTTTGGTGTNTGSGDETASGQNQPLLAPMCGAGAASTLAVVNIGLLAMAALRRRRM